MLARFGILALVPEPSRHGFCTENTARSRQEIGFRRLLVSSSRTRRCIFFKKNVLPVPQSPKRPIEMGGWTSLAAMTSQSASTSSWE